MPKSLMSFQRAFDEFLEGAGAVGDRVLGSRLHFAEGKAVAFGHEDRIVAETILSARRKVDRAIGPALENFGLRARRRKSQRAGEMRALVGIARFFHLLFDAAHGDAKVLCRARPARGIDPGRAI